MYLYDKDSYVGTPKSTSTVDHDYDHDLGEPASTVASLFSHGPDIVDLCYGHRKPPAGVAALDLPHLKTLL
jgi:hypothetical protein